jgi:hypothetical protein
MGATVLPFEPVLTVDEAWERYRALAAKLQLDLDLLTDRRFMEDLRRAEKRWRDLFDQAEAAK